MARGIHKLSDPAVRTARKPGRHSDGGGLYLNVTATGSKSWLFMWTRDGKRREMGMGPYPAVSLARARAKAAENRAAIEEGRDPIAEREQAPEPTFGQCADDYIASIRSEWRNEKHAWQWKQTLDKPCVAIRGKRVSEITTEDVLKVVEPIWNTHNETASRLRGRIERVLNYAKVEGWRSGENPAAWRDHLKNRLPKRHKLQRGHMAAMPYAEIPGFLVRLRASEAIAARALELTILTAVRSGEALGARWSEFDLERKLWTIPANRMKAAQEHIVPLTAPLVGMLEKMSAAATAPFVFSSRDPKKPLSNMAMLMLLRRMKVDNITVHGFRSSFRDWAGDETTFPRELAEEALAHRVGNGVEQAYRRNTAVEKRRKLMAAWANFCTAQPKNNVVQIKRLGA